jgi:hypothetical protein
VNPTGYAQMSPFPAADRLPLGDAAARRNLERIAAVWQFGHHPETSFEH